MSADCNRRDETLSDRVAEEDRRYVVNKTATNLNVFRMLGISGGAFSGFFLGLATYGATRLQSNLALELILLTAIALGLAIGGIAPAIGLSTGVGTVVALAIGIADDGACRSDLYLYSGLGGVVGLLVSLVQTIRAQSSPVKLEAIVAARQYRKRLAWSSLFAGVFIGIIFGFMTRSFAGILLFSLIGFGAGALVFLSLMLSVLRRANSKK